MGSGSPMAQAKLFRTAALASSAVFLTALAGCSARAPADTPPQSEFPAPTSPPLDERPDLAGGGPDAAAPADDLMGGPDGEPALPNADGEDPRLKTWRRADGALVTAMAPIANPEEPSARRRAERPVAEDGEAERPPVRHVIAERPRVEGPRVERARPVPTAASRPTVVRSAPPAKPAQRPAASKTAPVAPASLAPKTVSKAPTLQPVAPPAKPATALAKAPTPDIAPVVQPTAPPAAKPAPNVEALQAAVASAATSGAVLATAESLKTGKEGQVTLSLPATLGDLIKAQAAKLGLARPAAKVSAYAELEGAGYDVVPAGRQTAEVKPGEPATFAWQVKPTKDAQGALTTRFGASLDGVKPPQAFSLGAISKQIAAVPAKAEQAADRLGLAGVLDRTYDLPGVGKVSGKSLLGAALLLLALAILVAISRNAAHARTRAERRRKARAHADVRNASAEAHRASDGAPATSMNPILAAAGGAVVGAAGATALNNRQQHKNHQAAGEHEPFPAATDTRREPEPV